MSGAEMTNKVCEFNEKIQKLLQNKRRLGN